MASPPVAGTVALIMQKNGTLIAARAEAILEASAIPLPPGCLDVIQPSGVFAQFCLEAEAKSAGLWDTFAALLATP